MKIVRCLAVLLGFGIVACREEATRGLDKRLFYTPEINTLSELDRLFLGHESFRTDTFAFPVGKGRAKGYYDAQPFGRNNHLGEDWNAVTGGNSDLGQPVTAIAHGYVAEAYDAGGGWGPVVRIIHGLKGSSYRYVESLYAHCDTMLVRPGQWVRRGDRIATIGNAHGQYYAHLHLELRWKVGMRLGGGYSQDTTGFLAPTPFIRTMLIR